MTYRTPCGERRTYLAGCHCDACTWAHTRYGKQRALDLARGVTRRVPARDVLAVVDELNAAGYSDNAVGAAAGLASGTVCRLRNRPDTTASTRTLAAITAVRETVSGLVPADLTRLRIRSLMRAGWTLTALEQHTPHRLEGGKWRTVDRLNTTTAAAVRDLYQRLEHRQGPSPIAAGKAAGNGYPLPAEWDDPGTLAWPADVEPWTPPVRASRQGSAGRPVEWDDARWEDVDHLRSFGIPDEQIAERFGIKPAALERAERRAGRIGPVAGAA